MAISTFGRGVLSPLAADVKPIAADYYGRKRQREIGKKAEEAALSQAAVTGVQARRTAAAERLGALGETSLGIAQTEYLEAEKADREARAQAHELTVEGEKHENRLDQIEHTAGFALERAELAGTHAIDQIRERAGHEYDRLETTITADMDAAEKQQLFQSSEGRLDRASRESQTEYQRLHEVAQQAERELNEMTRHRETIDHQLLLAQEGSEEAITLQDQRLQATREENRLNRSFQQLRDKAARASALMNTELEATYDLRNRAYAAGWSYQQAMDLQELKNEWQQRTYDYYDKGVTQEGKISRAGAAAMGLSYDDVKNDRFDITYYHPKPGWDSDVVKPFVRLSGAGKSFDSLNPIDGNNVVDDPTTLFTAEGAAGKQILYQNRGTDTLILPLGENRVSLGAQGAIMLTSWEYDTLPKSFKTVLLEGNQTEVARYQRRAATIESEWNRIGRDRGFSQKDIDRSKKMGAYQGSIPFFTQLMSYTQGVTGERGGIKEGLLAKDANRFWDDVLNSEEWAGRPRPAKSEIPRDLSTAIAVERVGDAPGRVGHRKEAEIQPFYEGLREQKFLPNIDWDKLSGIERQAFRRLSRGLPEGTARRDIGGHWKEILTGLQKRRDAFDYSLTTPEEQIRFTELNRVKGLLDLLNDNHDLLRHTGKFFRGNFSNWRAWGADIPGVSSDQINFLKSVFNQLDVAVGTLTGGEGTSTSRYSKFNLEKLQKLIPAMTEAEKHNKEKVGDALAIVTKAIQTYGTPELQSKAVVPKVFEITAQKFGVPMTVNMNEYPWLEQPELPPAPLLTPEDLDPTGVVTRQFNRAAWNKIRVGQEIPYVMQDGRKGWIKFGPFSMIHPDDPEDLGVQPIEFR